MRPIRKTRLALLMLTAGAASYPALGYTVSLLPKVGVAQRADFVLEALAGR